MPNVWKYAIQGFQSGYDRSAALQGQKEEIDLRNQEQQRLIEQKKKFAESEVQASNERLKPLLRGEIPQEKKIEYLGTLPKEDLTRYKSIEELGRPEQVKTKNYPAGTTIYKLNPDGTPDLSNPIGTTPAKPETPKITELTEPTLNKKTGYWETSKGFLIDPKDKKKYPKTITIDGNLYAVTGTTSKGKAVTKGGNNKKDWTESTSILYNDFFKKQQALQRALEVGQYQGNVLPDVDTEVNGKLIYGRGSIEKAVTDWNKMYTKHVLDHMPSLGKEWYKQLYNQYNQATGEEKVRVGFTHPPAEDFWDNLINSYKKGELGSDKANENLTMRHLVELYRAIYSKEPKNVNPKNFENIDTIDEDYEDNE